MGRMTLSGLVASTAAERPDHEALVDVDRTWTYGELAVDVGRLTGTLIEGGVGVGDRVGVHLHKSAEGFIAVHAVVSAGAVAVPLDPSAPPERLARVCRSMGIACVVAHGPRRDSVEALARIHGLDAVVGLDGELKGVKTVVGPSEVAGTAPAAPVEVALDDWAYIITTSGSTGEPKGIVHTHRSALAYADASVDAFAVVPGDRIGDIAPNHFDQSTFALWSAPRAGSTVVIVPEPYQRLPASLSARLEEERVTIWYSVPFLLQQLVLRGDLDNRDLSALRLVKFGGEVPSGNVLARLLARVPNSVLVNVYGPAEVNQCSHHVVGPGELEGGVVPIGRPWPAAELRVVAAGEESPAGPETRSGELWVASSTMMAGYFAEPELDTDSIVEMGGRRWYRTGDLVEWNDHDALVFLGRSDHQVKVRGHRIEIEAIEAELERIDGVEAVVVAVERRDDGTDELVAGVVPAAPADDTSFDPVGAVEERARAHLPPWSRPHGVVTLRGISTTGSGKLDRRSLRTRLLSSMEEK